MAPLLARPRPGFERLEELGIGRHGGDCTACGGGRQGSSGPRSLWAGRDGSAASAALRGYNSA
jgi:hypothetical protein